MRIVRYTDGQHGPSFGAVAAEGTRPFPPGTSLDDILLGHAQPDQHQTPFDTSSTLLSPTGFPPSIRDFMSFEEHVVTSMAALGRTIDPVWYQQPTFYFSNPAAVIGPLDDVAVSPGTQAFDFELEIAAIIGQPGSDIPVDQAEHHIAAYALLCDWSARDLQEDEMKVGLGPAKGKDGATTIGPHLVTPEELEPLRTSNGYDLELTVHVNGRSYSRGNWSNIYWTFPQMIAYASRGTTLRTGDIIGSGTVGTGCILELGRVHGFDMYPYLTPGDEVTITGGPLGTLNHRIVAGPAPLPLTTR